MMQTDTRWLYGDGDMAERIRAHDWTATPLGPLAGWPQSLRTAVDMMLAMPGPATVLWGPAHVQLYNDAYVAVARDRHPVLLGRAVAEGWPDAYAGVIAPLLAETGAGRAVRLTGYPVALRAADGGLEERVFDTAWSPIRDEAGAVAGALQTLAEVTDGHRAQATLRESEERQAFLLSLSDALRPLSDPAAIQQTAMKLLAEKYDVMRAGYLDVHADGDTMTMAAKFERDAVPTPPQIRLSDYGSDLVDAFRAGRTLCVRDAIAEAETEEQRAAHLAIGVQSWIIAPLVKGGRLIAIVGVVARTPRDWTPTEIQLVTDLAERTWDAVQRARSEEALRESEERFAQFAASSADALWIRNATTLVMEYVSPAIETIYGVPPDALVDDPERWLALIAPEDRDGARMHLQEALAGEAVVHEFRIVRPSDGEERWIRNTDFPLRDHQGRVQRIGGIAEDVTDAKRATGRLEVLVNELQHRARNLLGVITAVAARTLGDCAQLAAFEARLKALSRAQGLLSQQGSDAVELGALVRAELAAHADPRMERVSLSGPCVQLSARQVQNFALALHELTTNAVKYGALKGDGGRLAVTWTHGQDAKGRPCLTLDWVETGIAVSPEAATRRGAGRELIENALSYALRARTDYLLGADGVRCRIELPLG